MDKQMNEMVRAWAAHARENAGHFVRHFATAVLYADPENYALMEPLALVLIEKYPSYLREEWPRVLADIGPIDINENPCRKFSIDAVERGECSS